MALEKTTFSEDEFAEFGDEVSLYCNIVSFVKDRPNEDLFMKFGGSSLPYIVVLDPAGNFLCKHEDSSHKLPAIEATYERGQEVYAAMAELRAEAAKGDAKAMVTLFDKQVELRHFDSKTGRKRLAAIVGISADLRARLQKAVDVIEFAELFSTAMVDGQNPAAVIPRYDELVAQGSRPDAGSAATFWYLYAEIGVKAGDLSRVERGIVGLQQVVDWLPAKHVMRENIPHAVKVYTEAIAKLRAKQKSKD